MKKYILKIKKYIIAEILLDMLCTIFAAYIPVLQKEMFDRVVSETHPQNEKTLVAKL